MEKGKSAEDLPSVRSSRRNANMSVGGSISKSRRSVDKGSNSTTTAQSIKLARLEMIRQLEKALEKNNSPEMKEYRNKYMKRL